MNKSELRKLIVEKRTGISSKQKLESKQRIIEQIKEDEHFLKADFVGLYYPAHQEMDITELIMLYPNKVFAYPKIVNDKIMYLQIDKNTELKSSSFGVKEPIYGFDITSKLEVILVPALGMTQNNYRLGYGKGYFDKFFKVYPNAYKIGIIYEGEEVTFEPTSFDVPLDSYFKG
ncbi:Probable 5-formyltetrahydrofolate cyclo-ligase [Acholeplasma oculi]|uniref:5-formyltetrahydrofolate cyclo-ligase n=1 Tax=Acholeplasma oculi TaxID=35623 RepID=A0A061AGL3_9MOLU|nr:5-formyltetrahydrofolate cyclo-ligase [Acholeplasma oculi]CDR30102.1 5-formyltetrahydrofolate cyclo-ligase [Acholeplasma oculi]SKC44817.1 5-formyltetrahydrofolate cyclo-ligase [Acholeplasma oculi]SUT88391.1 Probable 5-formyltetrahydrofolate cyclo-ligase [Acholeplasma oculi]